MIRRRNFLTQFFGIVLIIGIIETTLYFLKRVSRKILKLYYFKLNFFTLINTVEIMSATTNATNFQGPADKKSVVAQCSECRKDLKGEEIGKCEDCLPKCAYCDGPVVVLITGRIGSYCSEHAWYNL